MREYKIMITTTFGVESVVKHELRKLNYEIDRAENGRVEITGSAGDLARCNLRLRTAERVYLKLGEFTARDFDELYENIRTLPWADIIPYRGEFPVRGKSSRSELHSVPACQSIIKKAVVDSLQQKHGQGRLPEDGSLYPVFFSILDDRVIVALDSSGTGLHKRGYRQEAGEAPLQETTAAAMVLLSRWDRDRVLMDPFCGSGTILIESALLARKQAPGLKRSFAGENWFFLPPKTWRQARKKARQASWLEAEPRLIAGYDIDGELLKSARENAGRAGVDDIIHFQERPFREFSTSRKYGYVITNPPYGVRLKSQNVRELYREMGEKLRELNTWSYYILTAEKEFEKYFGKKASKRRKLYNGGIECQFYQYYGPWPPSGDDGSNE